MRKGKWFFIGIFNLVGLPFVIVGLLVSWFIPAAIEADIAHINALDVYSVTRLEDTNPGTEVLIEGTINADNAVLVDVPLEFSPGETANLVAFREEEYIPDSNLNDDDDDGRWVTLREEKPALRLDLPDGVVQINADTYTLQGEYYDTDTEYQYSGFAINDPVFVAGTVSPWDGFPRIDAEFVAHGDKASYIQAEQATATFMWWFGIAFAALGSLFVIIGWAAGLLAF